MTRDLISYHVSFLSNFIQKPEKKAPCPIEVWAGGLSLFIKW